MSKTYTDQQLIDIIEKVWEEVKAEDNIAPENATSLFAMSQHNKGFNRAKKILKRALILSLNYPQILENNDKQS